MQMSNRQTMLELNHELELLTPCYHTLYGIHIYPVTQKNVSIF